VFCALHGLNIDPDETDVVVDGASYLCEPPKRCGPGGPGGPDGSDGYNHAHARPDTAGESAQKSFAAALRGVVYLDTHSHSV
jgi:hypothetical protein